LFILIKALWLGSSYLRMLVCGIYEHTEMCPGRKFEMKKIEFSTKILFFFSKENTEKMI